MKKFTIELEIDEAALKAAKGDPLVERGHGDADFGNRIGPALKQTLPAKTFFHVRRSVEAHQAISNGRDTKKKPGTPDGVRATLVSDPEGI